MFYPKVDVEEAVNGWIITKYSVDRLQKEIYETLDEAITVANRFLHRRTKPTAISEYYCGGTTDSTLD